jgi:hypothetical protein
MAFIPIRITTVIPNPERQARMDLMGYMFLMSRIDPEWVCTQEEAAPSQKH